MRVTIFLCWSFVLLSHIKCIRMVVDADSLNYRFQASNLDIRLSGMSIYAEMCIKRLMHSSQL